MKNIVNKNKNLINPDKISEWKSETIDKIINLLGYCPTITETWWVSTESEEKWSSYTDDVYFETHYYFNLNYIHNNEEMTCTILATTE